MALRLMDGFDVYNAVGDLTAGGRWDTNGAGAIGTGGRFGGRCLTTNQVGTTSKNYGANDGTIFVTVAHLYNGSLPGTTLMDGYIQLRDGLSTPQVTIGFHRDGSISVRTGGTGGAAVATFPGAFAGTVWNGWTFKVLIHDTTGEVHIRKDGAASDTFSATGINTRGGSSNNYANTITLGGLSAGSASRFDDLAVYSADGAAPNDWLGDRRVETLVPNADTAQKDFSRSTGTNNFALVDELPQNGDTDYVFSSTVGAKDLYSFGSMSSTPQSIDAVQAVMLARKTDAGTRNAQLRVKSGGTEVGGVDTPLASTYQYQTRLDLTDPNTGVAWTQAAVNAIQAGPLVTA